MSSTHIEYLRREHARLEAEIDRAARQRRPDEVLIARLKKLKRAVKDQITAWSGDISGSRFA
ncbi:YdcH family protein [Sphingopyxis sp. R3-92]|uniref:YdcH family protein n=1 Tax=Sphingopyxis sp. R3-92 TaxID=3158553 RepID=UPI003EE79D93